MGEIIEEYNERLSKYKQFYEVKKHTIPPPTQFSQDAIKNECPIKNSDIQIPTFFKKITRPHKRGALKASYPQYYERKAQNQERKLYLKRKKAFKQNRNVLIQKYLKSKHEKLKEKVQVKIRTDEEIAEELDLNLTEE